jgi:hypothetical protein
VSDRPSWVGNEVTAKRQNAEELRPFLALARLAHAFAERALKVRAASPAQRPAQVQARLVVQASNQLRLVELAAERGYALQALGSVATLYELVSAVAFIGDDKARAEEWFGYSNWGWSYPSPKKRPVGIRQMLTASGGLTSAEIESRVKTWEDHHTAFCAAKHGNPVLLKKYGVSQDASGLKLYLGPIVGPVYTFLSQLALYHGSRILADGTVYYALPSLHKEGPAVKLFKRARARILNRINALAADPSFASRLKGATPP